MKFVRLMTVIMFAVFAVTGYAEGVADSGVIRIFCGFKLGAEYRGFSKKDKGFSSQTIVEEKKLVKPFRRCTHAKLEYGKESKRLFRITISSDPVFGLTAEAAQAEQNAMIAALRKKYEGQMNFFMWQGTGKGQHIYVSAQGGKYENKKALSKKGEKQDGYVFSVSFTTTLEALDGAVAGSNGVAPRSPDDVKAL